MHSHNLTPADISSAAKSRFTLLVLGLFAAIGLLALVGFARVVPVLLAPPAPIDFAAYYLAAHVIATGGDIYAQVAPSAAAQAGVNAYTGYIYPPQLAWLLSGLARLPFQPLATGWLITNVLVACLTVVLLGRHFRLSLLATILFLLAFLMLPATYNVLISGQVLLWLNFLLALLLILASKPQPEPWRSVLAGVLLAIAVVVKVYPAVAGVAGLLYRRWLLLATAFVAALIAVAVDVGDSWRWFSVVLPGLARSNAYATNQSLLGVSGRLFTVTAVNLPASAGGTATQVTLPPVLNAPQVASIMGYAAILAVGLVTLLAMVRAAQRKAIQPYTFELSFALALAAALLMSPISWSEYAVHLLIPFMVLLRWGWLTFPRGLVLAVAWLLLVLEKHWSMAVGLLHTPLATVFTFGAVMLIWLALVWTACRITPRLPKA